MGQVKTMQGGGEDLILQLRPSPLLSLGVTQGYITQLIFFFVFLLDVNLNKNVVGLKFLLILHMLAERSEISYYIMDHMFKFQVFVFKIMHKIWAPKWNRKWNPIDTKLGMHVKNKENM